MPAPVPAAPKGAVKDKVLKDAREHRGGPREGLTRANLDLMRLAGSTRAEVAVAMAELLTPDQAAAIAADLDSYGEWQDDPPRPQRPPARDPETWPPDSERDRLVPRGK